MLRPLPNEKFLKIVPVEKNAIPLPGKDLSNNWSDFMTDLTNQVTLGSQPSVVQDITAASGIKLSLGTQDVLMRIQSATAGDENITKNPQINDGFDGQRINIEGSDAIKTVTLDDGDGLQLTGGNSFTLADSDTISFHYNLTKNLWIENTRSKK